ncbi:unnamed protein product, partial [Tetraodon nigroviridis]
KPPSFEVLQCRSTSCFDLSPSHLKNSRWRTTQFFFQRDDWVWDFDETFNLSEPLVRWRVAADGGASSLRHSRCRPACPPFCQPVVLELISPRAAEGIFHLSSPVVVAQSCTFFSLFHNNGASAAKHFAFLLFNIWNVRPAVGFWRLVMVSSEKVWDPLHVGLFQSYLSEHRRDCRVTSRCPHQTQRSEGHHVPPQSEAVAFVFPTTVCSGWRHPSFISGFVPVASAPALLRLKRD